MEDFIKLEKGDINNLEGKVIAYARLIGKNSDFEEKIFALYATSNPVDFKEKFGEEVADQITQEVEKREFGLSENGFKNAFSICAVPLPMSLEDIKIASEDVIYVGNFIFPEACKIAVTSGVSIYMINYDKQRMLKAGITTHVGEQVSLPGEKTYFDIKEKERIDYLQNNYISPIMHDLEDNNLENAKKTGQDFVRFCEKSPLIDDAYGMRTILNSNEIKQKEDLLYTYFKKILAVASERFEEAAKIRDEIKIMKGKN